jgi:hypothetical protein
LAVRSPRATGLASSLSGYVSLTGQRCLFRHRRRCGRFSHVLPRRCVLPVSNAPFVPPFGVFRLADSRCREPPESFAPCWCAVTTVGPLGHCDSRQGRNRPALLDSTGSGFSSLLVARVPFSRDCRRANAASGTGESCLQIRSFDCVSRGTGPTSLTQSFPGRPGLSDDRADFDFRFQQPVVLSMNCLEANRNSRGVNQMICTELFTKTKKAGPVWNNDGRVETRAGKVVHRGNCARRASGE